LKALILAGGFATRLRPLSCTRPKILFPIVNKPLLQWTFERLSKSRVNEIILAVNYQTEVAIRQHKIPKYDLKIKYSRDPLMKPLGSGGPVKKAEKLVGHDEPFLVLNGDIFADMDYLELLEKHKKGKGIATIALTRVEDPSKYGVAVLEKDGRISKFVEKPSRDEAPSNIINAGTYALSPEIFEYIPAGKKVSIEREVFTRLAEEGELYGYVFDGLWFDIGKPEDYLRINKILLKSLAEQKFGVMGKVELRKPVAFDVGVSIGEASIVGPNVVLGKNVRIGTNVHVRDSIVFSNTQISDSCSIETAIIGDSVIIGKGVKIMQGCILADHVKVKDNVTLSAGVTVCPAKEIEESVLTPKNIC